VKTVWVLKITTKTLNPTVTIGAVYESEEKARAEAKRLSDANAWTVAVCVMRQLGE